MTWKTAWPSHALTESRRRLADLRNELDHLPDTSSPEVEQAISRFLVIRCCGHIEFTFEETFCSLAEAQASPGVASYVRSGFFRGSNPHPSRLTGTLDRLNKSISNDLSGFLSQDDQRVHRELGFLIDRRNRIAHGQSENVSRRKALDLASIALEIGDWITEHLDPRSSDGLNSI